MEVERKHPRFTRVMREICQSAEIPDWRELMEHGLLIIDDVEMQLRPEVMVNDECILLRVDFSVVPSKGVQDFLRLLLELNFMADAPESRIFSTNPESDQVVAMRRILLKDGIDGKTVIEMLREEAQAASTWQHDWPNLVPVEEPIDFFMALKA